MLSWAVHAKNLPANVKAFSPYQLAIGYLPHIAALLNDTASASESDTVSELLRKSLNDMAAARKDFLQSENFEKFRRALRHNARTCAIIRNYTGENVIYKPNDSEK